MLPSGWDFVFEAYFKMGGGGGGWVGGHLYELYVVIPYWKITLYVRHQTAILRGFNNLVQCRFESNHLVTWLPLMHKHFYSPHSCNGRKMKLSANGC